MKYFLLLLLLWSLKADAQKPVPRFENDTLYTTIGFKVYNGQTLRFAKGTGTDGAFRFIRLTPGGSEKQILTGDSVIVRKLKRFSVSPIGTGYIHVKAMISYKDSTTGEIEFNMAFDRAIEGFPGLPAEVIVPEEFRNKAKGSVSDEISKLYKLYQDSIITKEEFEMHKKKLLEK